MCPQPPVMKDDNRTAFNLRLISLMDKNTKEIGITGGEPTLIGNDLFIIIKALKKQLPCTSVSVLSNGVRFADKEYAMKYALCNHPDIQIDIPIFSDIPEIHNKIVGANTFYKTVQGLYNLSLFNQRIGLRIVVHKMNYRRLPQMADYIYHNFPFVVQVAFMQMETIGLADSNIKELWIDPYDYNAYLETAVLALRDRGMVPYIYNSQLCILPPKIHKFAVQSISDWKDVFLKECEECVLRTSCAGLFASNQNMHSKHIKAVKK